MRVTSVTARAATKRTRIAAFVIEDLPLAGRSGYCTYNRAFLAALVAGGWETHLIVLGPRLPAPVFRPATVLGMSSVRLHIPAARYCLGRYWVTAPRSAARAWFHVLSARLPRRIAAWVASRRRPQSSAIGAAVIGRMSGLADSLLVGSLIKRIRPDVILVDTIFRAPAVASVDESVPRVLVAHDVFFKRCASLAGAGLAPTPFVTVVQERELLTAFATLIAISDNDAADLRMLAPTTPVSTLRSPIASASTTATLPDGPARILYLGSAAHHNVEGLRWFLETTWPTIVEECPGITLDVVGSVGEALPDVPAGVRIHGRLADISTVAKSAAFAINPVRAGSGLKIKMLDYFAHGLPCVTTSLGAQGFPESADRPIGIGDSPREFAGCVSAWERDRTAIVQLRAAAHRYVTQFSLSSFNLNLTALLNAVSASEPPPSG